MNLKNERGNLWLVVMILKKERDNYVLILLRENEAINNI